MASLSITGGWDPISRSTPQCPWVVYSHRHKSVMTDRFCYDDRSSDAWATVPQPLEFGHRVLVIQDSAGFVCHYAILPRGAEDSEVLVEEMKQ